MLIHDYYVFVLYFPDRKKNPNMWNGDLLKSEFEAKPQVPINNLRAGVFAPDVKEKH